jgi:hypothetical protein
MGRGRARKTIELIEASTEILHEIQPCSVRAICYRLFTLGLISSMAKGETNKVGRVLVEARERREIPFDWIVDETRQREQVATWDDPVEFGEAITSQYRKHKWVAQPTRIEVWSEKSTVRGTLAPVLEEFEVAFVSVHGFTSCTAVQDLVRERLRDPKPLVVLYVGDWDPSGLHMSEVDIPGRTERYTRAEWSVRHAGNGNRHDGLAADVADLDIRRIALTAEDIADPDLPSFGAETKAKDPRHAWFTRRYGQRCWELDAMSPNVLRGRVADAIRAEIDQPVWDRYVRAEELELESIVKGVRAWNAISEPAPEWADPTE